MHKNKLIIPARVVNTNNDLIMPAYVRKYSMETINSYINEFIYRIKPILERDLELESISSYIDICIEYHQDKNFYTSIIFPNVNSKMFKIIINGYTFYELSDIMNIDRLLQSILIFFSSEMRKIYQFYNIYACNMTMQEYIDSENLYDLSLNTDCIRYSSRFSDKYKIEIPSIIGLTISYVEKRIYHFNVPHWIYYVLTHSNILEYLSNTLDISSEIVFQNWYMSEENKDLYYIIDYHIDRDVIVVRFNSTININNDRSSIIDYTVSLIGRSICDIYNECNNLLLEYIVDEEYLELVINNLFEEYLKIRR